MQLQNVPVSKLKFWRENPRRGQHAVAAVAGSISTFGFNAPILCDKDLNVIAGNTRLAAAKRLKMKTVPVVILPIGGWRKRAYAIADNKTATLAEWDHERLKSLLVDLRAEVDLSSMGFMDAEIDALLRDEIEFDWESFDRNMMERQFAEYALVPVKVPAETKAQLVQKMRDAASSRGISGTDFALVAGKLLMDLMEVGA